MKSLKKIVLAAGIGLSLLSFDDVQQKGKPRVLVFSKTSGFRHESISAGKKAILQLGRENGFDVDTTENAAYFSDDSLRNYKAVVFLNTTGNALNMPQQLSFERFIQAGGGFAGVHAAADTEYDWPWYGKLVGGYFLSHPQVQPAVINVKDRTHSASAHLPEKWTKTDEWYNYKNLNPDVNVLMSLDESSYRGGTNGSNHPISWHHLYDGGRAFYTGMGHTLDSYVDPLFLKHLLGGIRYAIGNNEQLDYSKARSQMVPEENRLIRTVLTEGTLFEPTEMTILPNLDVLIVQRRGELMLYKSSSKTISQAGFLDVYSKTSTPGVNAEEGVLGIAADPAFSKNQYVYIFYSPADTSVNRLSRFRFANDKLDSASEKIILELYSQRNICCHTGGSIAFGPDGLLYLSTGDNSTPFDVPREQFVNKGYAPLDNRKGLHQYDARRSSGNTNDLRGKILRIRVLPDGTYSIPEGNLFPVGQEKTRPEIYVMGNRNPYRISIDSKSGFLYWGEVGPDAQNDDLQRGPKGYDEINQARKAGFFGWPFFVGNNYPYRQYDYTNGQSGDLFDKNKALNNSPNNTGVENLPPVSPPFIWYPYAISKEFPDLGSGGRSAAAGPVYHSELYPTATRYPSYYDNKLFIYDWIRGWIKAVSMKTNGDYDSMEDFMPGTPFAAPIDMELGPDGRIYVLEYGKGWFTQNPDAALVRIDYVYGNRPPKISTLTVADNSGLMPYKLRASVSANDPDKDPMTYVWNFGNGVTRTTSIPSVEYTYPAPGEYEFSVEITDTKNASTTSTRTPVFAGNARPELTIEAKGNQTFYFPGKPISYKIGVKDTGAQVVPTNIHVSTSYENGSDLAGASLGHQEVPDISTGQALMLKSDCQACHRENAVSVGPAYMTVAAKYPNSAKSVDYLATKIIKGGGGVWGEVAMPAHPTMSVEEASKIARWVLSLRNTSDSKGLPAEGSIIPAPENENSVFVLHASYTDLGQENVKPLSAARVLRLRSSTIDARDILERNNMTFRDSTSTGLIAFPISSGWLKLPLLDLTDISGLTINYTDVPEEAQFDVEVRVDNINGPLLGRSEIRGGGGLEGTHPVKIGIGGAASLHDVFIRFRSSKQIRRRPSIKSITFNTFQ